MPSKPLLFSPPQLSYIHSSLSLRPPIRPDARSPTTFRALRAETDILPAANGSARVCFPGAEGGEAVVGIRAEVEATHTGTVTRRGGEGGEGREGKGKEEEGGEKEGDDGWVEVGIELREDETEGVVLAEMVREALVADGRLRKRLVISGKWHWRLVVDIVLLSPPSTYPLPLLSLTTHLALLSCRLPALISSLDDDPMFNDDWDAAIPLYPFVDAAAAAPASLKSPTRRKRKFKPPITLLIISVGENIFFDPSSEELAVADAVVAISVGQVAEGGSNNDIIGTDAGGEGLRLLAIRTIDPPSRQFAATTTAVVAGTEGGGEKGKEDNRGGGGEEEGVWRKKMGGMKRGLVGRMMKMILEGGVGGDVFRGLENWA